MYEPTLRDLSERPGYEYDLLPCPFCGSKRAVIRGSYSSYVLCLDCEASTGCCQGRKEAADAWNRRNYADEE